VGGGGSVVGGGGSVVVVVVVVVVGLCISAKARHHNRLPQLEWPCVPWDTSRPDAPGLPGDVPRAPVSPTKAPLRTTAAAATMASLRAFRMVPPPCTTMSLDGMARLRYRSGTLNWLGIYRDNLERLKVATSSPRSAHGGGPTAIRLLSWNDAASISRHAVVVPGTERADRTPYGAVPRGGRHQNRGSQDKIQGGY
jgi:hypothetical protein